MAAKDKELEELRNLQKNLEQQLAQEYEGKMAELRKE